MKLRKEDVNVLKAFIQSEMYSNQSPWIFSLAVTRRIIARKIWMRIELLLLWHGLLGILNGQQVWIVLRGTELDHFDQLFLCDSLDVLFELLVKSASCGLNIKIFDSLLIFLICYQSIDSNLENSGLHGQSFKSNSMLYLELQNVLEHLIVGEFLWHF